MVAQRTGAYCVSVRDSDRTFPRNIEFHRNSTRFGHCTKKLGNFFCGFYLQQTERERRASRTFYKQDKVKFKSKKPIEMNRSDHQNRSHVLPRLTQLSFRKRRQCHRFCYPVAVVG